jgi:hypothetical protein
MSFPYPLTPASSARADLSEGVLYRCCTEIQSRTGTTQTSTGSPGGAAPTRTTFHSAIVSRQVSPTFSAREKGIVRENATGCAAVRVAKQATLTAQNAPIYPGGCATVVTDPQTLSKACPAAGAGWTKA